MRRILALVVALALIQLATGCRHVAGKCDCDHATGGKVGQGDCCGSVAAPAPAPVVPPAAIIKS